MTGDLLHLTCRDFAGFQQKQLAYAAAWALERHQKGKKTSMAGIFSHTLGAFLKTLLLRGGVLDGKQGWLLAMVNAQYTLSLIHIFDLVQCHERIPGCDLYRAGDGVHRRWLQQRSRILPAWKSRLLFADRYHRYVMQAEREMYEDPHLRGVICNAEMIKREIITAWRPARSVSRGRTARSVRCWRKRRLSWRGCR